MERTAIVFIVFGRKKAIPDHLAHSASNISTLCDMLGQLLLLFVGLIGGHVMSQAFVSPWFSGEGLSGLTKCVSPFKWCILFVQLQHLVSKTRRRGL